MSSSSGIPADVLAKAKTGHDLEYDPPAAWVEVLARAMVAHDGDDWDDPALTPYTPRSRVEEFRESYRQAARVYLAALDQIGALAPMATGGVITTSPANDDTVPAVLSRDCAPIARATLVGTRQVSATTQPSMRVRLADGVMRTVTGAEMPITPGPDRTRDRIDLLARSAEGLSVMVVVGEPARKPRRPAVPDGYEVLAYVHVRRGAAAITDWDIECPQ